MFGEAPCDARRLLTLLAHLPPESMLIRLNSDEDGNVTLNGRRQQPPPKRAERTVTSLSGVNMRELYGR